jgi:hypothetical protein
LAIVFNGKITGAAKAEYAAAGIDLPVPVGTGHTGGQSGPVQFSSIMFFAPAGKCQISFHISMITK